VKEFFYMQDCVGTDRGWAFVTYDDETEAAVAVAMFHGQQIFPGSARPLQCKFNSEQITKIEGTVFEAPTKAVTPWQEFTTPEGKPYYFNSVTKETRWEKPPELGGQSPAPVVNQTLALTAQAAGGSGPMGANIFVFHVPINWTDDDFHAHFAPFGQIVSAKIHVDPLTKASKGFGFVSYATPQAATMAIKGMNGFDTKQGKFLKVTIKKGEEQYNPDAVTAQNVPVQTGSITPPTQAIVGVQPTVALGLPSSQLQAAASAGRMLKAAPMQPPQLALPSTN